MTTRTDEIKAEIARLQVNIDANKTLRNAGMERVELIDGYIAQLEKQKLRLQAQFEREDTVMIKPEGPCVTLSDASGVEWKL